MNSKMKEVNDKILAGIARGHIPWRPTWNCQDNRNPITGTKYRGINWALTTVEIMSKNYQSNLWLTFLQAKKLGGYIRKGEKGTSIFYFEKIMKKKEDEGDKDEFYFLQRSYTVFNYEQCEGVELPNEITYNNVTHTTAEMLIENYVNMPEIFRGNPAYYPSLHKISMPDISAFENSAEYYAAFFHELSHCATHQMGLNEDMHGNDGYSMGELIAEITAYHLMTHVGLVKNYESTQAYVNNWLKKLKDNECMIIKAIQTSEKVFDFIIQNSTQKEGAK